MLRQLQKLFDAPGLGDGEALPGLDVVVHGLVHAGLALDGLEPHPVHGQPVPGVGGDELQKLLPAQVFQGFPGPHMRFTMMKSSIT